MPEIPTIRLLSSYVVADETVYATVYVGEGQRGKWEIFVGEDSKGDGREPRRVEIGAGQDLIGKTLEIDALVTDTNPHTNRTSIRIHLEGGLVEKVSNLEHTVNTQGGSVYYLARFTLDEEET